jgi:hypothetical protein
MKHLLNFSGFLFEDNGSSADQTPCTYYQDKQGDSGYKNFWAEYSNMSPEEQKTKMKGITAGVLDLLEVIKDEYVKWYSNPATIKKFTQEEDKVRMKLLSEYLPKITCKLHTKPDPNASKMKQASWGWFSAKAPYIINVALYNFFNGKSTGNKSIKDTIKHEMAHAIDVYFSENGVRAYDATHPPITTPGEYERIYLMNDKDQFARLNILRGIIKAGPTDSGKQLLVKFLDEAKKGKISSESFDFKGGVSPKGDLYLLRMIPKRMEGVKGKVPLDVAKKVYSSMMNKGAIMVGGKENFNLEQLFSNFGRIINNEIVINMSDIAQLNYSSKNM